MLFGVRGKAVRCHDRALTRWTVCRYHPSSVPLTAFEGSSLEPHEFKEQLKLAFNGKSASHVGARGRDKGSVAMADRVGASASFFRTPVKLSPKELGALMDYFDKVSHGIPLRLG